MKMEFVDEEELETEEEEGERGKIVLIGEPTAVCDADGTFTDVRGGSFDMAVGLANSGHPVLYCARVGKDAAGKFVLSKLKKAGVAAVGVMAVNGVATKIGGKPGKPAVVPVPAMSRLDLYGCDFLHISGDFAAVSGSAFEALRRLIARAKALDIFVTFAPAYRAELWGSKKEAAERLNTLAQEADLAVLSVPEGKLLTGKESAADIAAYYHGMGVDSVIVRIENEGAYWSCGGENGLLFEEAADSLMFDCGEERFVLGVVSAVADGLSLHEAAQRGAEYAAAKDPVNN